MPRVKRNLYSVNIGAGEFRGRCVDAIDRAGLRGEAGRKCDLMKSRLVPVIARRASNEAIQFLLCDFLDCFASLARTEIYVMQAGMGLSAF